MCKKIENILAHVLDELSGSTQGHFLGVQVILGGKPAGNSLRLAKANQRRKKPPYDKLVSQFVRCFGRKNLVADYLEGHESYEFRIEKNCASLDIKLTRGQHLWVKLSPEVYNALCPGDALKPFQVCMQSTNRSTVTALEHFAHVSAVCIADVLPMTGVIPALDKYLARNAKRQRSAKDVDTKTKLEYWKFLQSLQHTLLLLQYLRRTYSLKASLGFSIFSKEQDGNRILLLAAPQLGAPSELHNRLQSALRAAIADLRLTKYAKNAIKHKPVGLENGPSAVTKGFVQEIFTNEGRKSRAEYQLLWGMALAERLSSAIHEGRPLEFYFLIADETAVQDNAMLSYHPFGKNDNLLLQPLSLKKPQGEDRKVRLKHSTVALRSEHFPWFANGKHALLWNASNDELTPAGLVKLRTETWASLVRKSYTPKYKLEYQLPSSMLTYIPAGGREPGVIGVHDYRGNGVTVLKNLARFITIDYRPTWIETERDKRKRVLACTIKKTLEQRVDSRKTRKDLADELTDVAVRAADDPNLGGTLLVVTSANPQLKGSIPLQMGNNWLAQEKQLTSEDKLALLGHDGATLVKLNTKPEKPQWDWSFRHLLMLDVSDKWKKIAKWRKDDGGQSPFDWLGSRRMSAAMAALPGDIDAVIVISQDGDIVLWYADGNERICQRLTRGPDRRARSRWSVKIRGR